MLASCCTCCFICHIHRRGCRAYPSKILDYGYVMQAATILKKIGFSIQRKDTISLHIGFPGAVEAGYSSSVTSSEFVT